MTTHNKTLADARPGGRVRLGDQAERARFEEWHCEKFKTKWLTGAPTRDLHNGVYAENYGPAEQQARWELWQAAWQAALSAQPSPGGQGARAQFEEYRGGDCERDAQGYYVNARTAQDWAMWQTALAARQPVCTTCDGSRVDPGGKPVCRDCARHPVGEPVGYFDPDVLAHLTEGLIDPVGVLRRKPNGKSNVPVWLGPPAQAVDLGQFRAAVYEARCSHEAMERKAEMQECDRLLALIDGKAVGE